ncbi:MAG: hypothetical protein BGO01_12195 [Armatimonadetes bacterium 55-13]|nr:nitroreductase [Armatimonadota bacterium]OJU63546.1 MAG: hypothetical protein BGO01_12195 [Armatimonadetes bacterium 55-13]
MPDLHPDATSVLMDVITQRRSMGLARLKPDAVPVEILQQMMEAANWAPSNGDTEPWRFTIFSGDGREELANAFGEAYRTDIGDGAFDQVAYDGYRARAYAAPVWIAIGMEPGKNEDGSLAESQDEEIMAVACAVQNFHLIATTYGLSGMWHSKGTSTHPAVAKALGLDSPSRLLGLFFLGYPEIQWPEGERRPLESKVRWA